MFAADSALLPSAAAARAKQLFENARKLYLAAPTNVTLAWEFGRAAFDRAEFATNHAERAVLAQEGIAACRQAITADPACAAAHYYLGMNLGQLARSKPLGALKIVRQMEREFKTARALDKHFDYAGPDRNLGLLYLHAPAVGSIGDQTKARAHLRQAVTLAGNYPENRLNLIEAHLKWRERANARLELRALEALWPQARTEFAGEGWAASWEDWERRRAAIRKKLGDATPRRSAVTKPGSDATNERGGAFSGE